MINDTFCVLPFMHLATNASGNFRVCCNSTPGENQILDADGKSTNLSKDDIEEVWNSDFYKDIRQQFLDNKRPTICARCFEEEDAGVKSARKSFNESWFSDDIELRAHQSKMNVRYIDLRLGNLCNLKCRMCNPYASSMWVKEWNEVVGSAQLVPNEKLDQEDLDFLSKMDWFNQSKVWENIAKVADSIEEIYLTGGEPTLATAQYELFQYLHDKQLSQNIRLKYNTNLTNIPKEMVWHWHRFKLVKINASIDAVGPLDRYIRYPSSWDKVFENFKELRRLRNTRMQVHTTVQTYNILHLPEIYKWADSIMFDDIYLNILNHPYCLNVRTLPDEIKQEAEKRLQPYLNRPKVKQLIKYMWKDSWFDSYWKEFVNYTNVMDQKRNENILELIPEYKDYWN